MSHLALIPVKEFCSRIKVIIANEDGLGRFIQQPVISQIPFILKLGKAKGVVGEIQDISI